MKLLTLIVNKFWLSVCETAMYVHTYISVSIEAIMVLTKNSIYMYEILL